MSDARLSPRALLPLLVVFTAVGPVALNLPLPAVPGLARDFAVDPGIIQLTITLYLAGMATAQLFLGPLSDRYGRRPVLIGSLGVAALMSLVAAFVTTAPMLIVARVLQSFGASAGQVVSRAVIRDVFDRDNAASMIGWVTMAMVLAPMVAPTIGGLINENIGWRWVFVATFVIASFAMLLAVVRLPETRATAASPSFGQLVRDAGLLVRDRQFVAYLLIGALSSITFFAFIGGAPHIVVSLMGESSTTYGLWFMINACGYMIGNAVCGRFAARIGSDRLIVWGSVLMALFGSLQFAIAWFGYMTHPAMLFVPQAAIAFANGLQLPGAIAGAVGARQDAAGSASGLVGFTQMGLGAVAVQLAGMGVGSWMSPVPMTALTLFGAWGALAALALLRRPDRY
jgi:DHA1 family bicyclomycin/chloramphenicol resistance-like MFS transporter